MTQTQSGHPLRDGLSSDDGAVNVSTLRASIPDAVRVITRDEVLRGVADRFASAYGSTRDYEAAWKRGWTRGQIIDALSALHGTTPSVETINSIIGVTGWATNECDMCGDDKPILIQIGSEPDYDTRWQDVCTDCIINLAACISKAVEADAVSA